VLLIDQSPGRRRSDLRLAGVVGIERLDRPPEHAASLVDAVQRELRAILLGLPPIGEGAAENGGDADADRLGGLGDAGAEQQGEKEDGAHRGGSLVERLAGG
jgi:hypothetical protein